MGPKMAERLKLEGEADMASLAALLDSIESFGQCQAWPVDVISKLRLVVEEAVINVIAYGSPGQAAPKLEIGLEQEGSQLKLTIADNGIAFDPLRVTPPNLDAGLEEREVGGLGIYLILQLMDSVSYQRDGVWNRLLMSKSLV